MSGECAPPHADIGSERPPCFPATMPDLALRKVEFDNGEVPDAAAALDGEFSASSLAVTA